MRERDEENAAFGSWLVEVLAEFYGCEKQPDAISRRAYKTTDCGAWLHFDEKGILVGTIVEGSGAETWTRVDVSGLMDLDDEPARKELISRVMAGLQKCEDFAAEVWAEIEDSDD